MLLPTWTLFTAFLPLALARLPDGRAHGNVPPRPTVPKITANDAPMTDVTGAALPPLNTTYYFDQLIDHTNPKLGTFKQRFWHTWEWYEEGARFYSVCMHICAESVRIRTGGPIILFTPGEANADGTFTPSLLHTPSH